MNLHSLQKGLKGCWYFFWGHLLGYFFYEKKYLCGRWFTGRYNGLCSIGWQWVTYDAISRFFSLDNQTAKFPINQQCRVICPENIDFDPNDLNNFHSYGIYYQALGKIYIGSGSYIGPNVGLITSNHEFNKLDKHMEPEAIVLGEKCWIGMNSTILPGVILGDRTVVGAGSVVTHSFPYGHCLIAGNPARLIKRLD